MALLPGGAVVRVDHPVSGPNSSTPWILPACNQQGRLAALGRFKLPPQAWILAFSGAPALVLASPSLQSNQQLTPDQIQTTLSTLFLAPSINPSIHHPHQQQSAASSLSALLLILRCSCWLSIIDGLLNPLSESNNFILRPPQLRAHRDPATIVISQFHESGTLSCRQHHWPCDDLTPTSALPVVCETYQHSPSLYISHRGIGHSRHSNPFLCVTLSLHCLRCRSHPGPPHKQSRLETCAGFEDVNHTILSHQLTAATRYHRRCATQLQLTRLCSSPVNAGQRADPEVRLKLDSSYRIKGVVCKITGPRQSEGISFACSPGTGSFMQQGTVSCAAN